MKRLISTPASRPATPLSKVLCPTQCPARRCYSHQHADAKKASDPTLQMRRRAPLKTIPDTLHPTPCIQFTSLLDDLVPDLAAQHQGHNNGDSGRQAPVVLPQGAHLVYFPPLQPASQLAPDGADADHVPPDFGPLATTWHGSSDGGNSEGGRRLWAGGEVTFRDGWQREAVADGRAWVCREEIAGARALGGGRRVVSQQRRRPVRLVADRLVGRDVGALLRGE